MNQVLKVTLQKFKLDFKFRPKAQITKQHLETMLHYGVDGGVIIVIATHFLLRNEWIDKVHKVMYKYITGY